MMHSTESRGPVVNPRSERLWTWIDPLGFRDNFRYEFEMDLVDLFETTSTARVMVGERVLKEGNTFNDHYGFGTSREEAISHAVRLREELSGANLDVAVSTVLTRQACFFDDDNPPLLSSAVRLFRVPNCWCSVTDKTRRFCTETEYEVWKNGAAGKDAAALEKILAETQAADSAGARRHTPLQ